MKIIKAMFVADRVRLNQRLTGTITVPEGAKIVYCGADPSAKGNLAVWAEAPSIALPLSATISIPLIILKADDEIPAGAIYRGHLLAVPILLVYELPRPGGDNAPN